MLENRSINKIEAFSCFMKNTIKICFGIKQNNFHSGEITFQNFLYQLIHSIETSFLAQNMCYVCVCAFFRFDFGVGSKMNCSHSIRMDVDELN